MLRRRVVACLLIVLMLSALLPQQALGATLLKRGSRGAAVQQLQQQLIKLGFLKGSADGIFGPQTEAAVRSFQKAYGLKQDGIAGPATLGKLAEVLSGSKGNDGSSSPPQSPPQSGGSSGSSSAPITTTLKLGSKGSQVVTLQKRLNELGYNCGAADGIFGSKTRQAVMAFQKDNGLAVDGIVGPKTIAKLFPSKPPQDSKPEPKPEPEPEPQPEPGFTQFHGTPGALAGKVIFLDAGHGGTDSGATAKHEGYGTVREKEMNFDMVMRLKRILEEAGATVILTRSDDRYYSLFYRSALVNTHILQTEVAAVKKDRDAALQEKQVKEEQIKKLEDAKESLPQYEARLNELGNKLELVEKYEEYLQKEEQVRDVSNQLEDAKTQKERLMQEYQDLVIDMSKLNEDVQNLDAALTALEAEQEKKAVLIEQLNKVKEDLEAINTALGENDLAKAIQEAEKLGRDTGDLANMVEELEIDNATKEPMLALLNQIGDEDLPGVKESLEYKKSLEEQIAQLNARIADLEGQLPQLQQELDALAEELDLPGSKNELDNALAKKDETRVDLEEVKKNIDKVKADIAGLVDTSKSTGEILSQIEGKLPVLRQEKKALEEQIAAKEANITLLNTRIEQFKVYLNNPGLTDRVGIYGELLMGGKRYATPELAEVLDLTRQKYQDNYLFISIHCNATATAGDQTSASGISIFYRDNGPYSYDGTYGVNVEYYQNYNAAEREKFAKALLQQLNAISKFSKKYTAPYKADFSVLRENNLISVLVEVGFINNPNDRALLIKEQTREDVAAGIYKGIVEYYKK